MKCREQQELPRRLVSITERRSIAIQNQIGPEAWAHLDTPTIDEVAPLPARHERGEGSGEGLVPPNCRALLKSPLPTSPSWGEGIAAILVVVSKCAHELESRGPALDKRGDQRQAF